MTSDRRVVERIEVQRMVATGARLAEVLPRHEYEDEHLPDALHVPLKEIATASAVLSRTSAVIVYCWDGL